MKKLFLLLLSTTILLSSSMDFEDDKQKHLGASFLIGTATGVYMDYNYKNNSYSKNLLIGTSIAMVPGVLKEIYDSSKDDNKLDGADIAYDLLGSLIGNITGNYISKNLFIDIKKQKIAYNIKF